MSITYDALGFKLAGVLEFCDRCARSKAKMSSVRKKTYTQATNLGESIFVETTGTFLESLMGDCYWIGIVSDYSQYSWSLFTKTK